MHTIITITLAFILGATLSAQEGKNTVEFRFLTFDRHANDSELYYRADDNPLESVKPIKLAKNNFSETINITGNFIHLYRKDALVVGKEVATIRTSNTPSKKWVYVLIPRPDTRDTKGKYVISQVSDTNTFSNGQRMILNLSKYQIGCRLDKTMVRVTPGEMKILPAIDSPDGKGQIESEIRMKKKGEERWLPLSSSIWKNDPKARTYVFFYWDPKKKRVRIRSVREVL